MKMTCLPGVWSHAIEPMPRADTTVARTMLARLRMELLLWLSRCYPIETHVREAHSLDDLVRLLRLDYCALTAARALRRARSRARCCPRRTRSPGSSLRVDPARGARSRAARVSRRALARSRPSRARPWQRARARASACARKGAR